MSFGVVLALVLVPAAIVALAVALALIGKERAG
jgi:hypothetical protein